MHDSPIRLMRFQGAARHDPSVDHWFEMQSANLGSIAKSCFDFIRGLGDPAKILEGTGKRMRHVKLKPGQKPDPAELEALIESAYHDMLERLSAGAL